MSTAGKQNNDNTFWHSCRKWLAKHRDEWIRAVFMIIYLIVLYIALWLMVLLILVQFVCRLVAGKANNSLCQAGAQLADYSRDIIRFLCYKSETKPWPFADSKSGKRSGGQK